MAEYSYSEDELAMLAQNVVVEVGTILPLPPGTLPTPAHPANIFTMWPIANVKTEPIGKDRTDDLANRTKPNPPTKYQVKNYGDPIEA